MTVPSAEPSVEDTRSGTVVVFLSLFLLVLAFFIVLVAISTVEQGKSKAVLNSVSATFTPVDPSALNRTDFTAKEGVVLAGQPFQERITGLFSTALQVARIEVVKPGRLMRAVLPQDAIFVDGEETVRDSLRPFMDRVAAALGARPPGMRFDMEFIIGTPDPASGLPTGRTLETARAGAFARAMVGRGAPPDSIAVGLAPVPSRDVTLRFYTRRQDDVRVQARERAAP